MTDQEINAAIAEECGKLVCRHQPEKWERRGPDGDSELFCTECKEYLSNMRVADYCNDLNASHEMEKVLPYDPEFTYAKHLHKMTAGRGEHATARQRAEAFMRVRGKRKE